MLVTQAGRVLFIVPLRYLFAIGLQYIMDEHQYLAFDVSLPPLNNLSCSPKQLDSDNWHLNWQAILGCAQNVTVTLYGVRENRIPTLLDFQRTEEEEKSWERERRQSEDHLVQDKMHEKRKRKKKKKKCHATIPSSRQTRRARGKNRLSLRA